MQRTVQSCFSPNAAAEGRRPVFIPALGNAQGKLFPTEKGLKARHQVAREPVSRWFGPSALARSLLPNLGRRSCLALAQAEIKPGLRPSHAVLGRSVEMAMGEPRIARITRVQPERRNRGPKARSKPAQGNALGMASNSDQALKGRDKIVRHNLCRPFRAGPFLHSFPGRCPGLACCRTFGAEERRSGSAICGCRPALQPFTQKVSMTVAPSAW